MDANKPAKVGAFFDLDNTLISGATLLIAAPVLYREKIIPFSVLVQALKGSRTFSKTGADEQKVERLKEIALDIFEGRNQEKMFGLVDKYLNDLFGPRMFDDAKKAVNEHFALGHEVVVVSSSPIELVRPIAAMFGIDPNNVIATEVKLDESGCYTREFAQWVSGKAKPGAIIDFARRNGIDLNVSFGYTDSKTDIGFLEIVGRPYAVNPDETLRATALENEWGILLFDHPERPVNRPIANALQDHRLLVGAGAAGLTAAGVSAGIVISRRYSQN